MDTLSPISVTQDLSDTSLPADIRQLLEVVARLPEEYRAVLNPVLEQVVAKTKRRQNTMKLLQEAFSQLRMDMKYLIFDLEATIQERDAFRLN
ncbi:MAG: transcriptional regulator [Planctomycetia bacterium]|nr:transcriptional regulator [Planctomycetia bacterium]